MSFKDLYKAYKNRKGEYWLWLIANLGALLISFLGAITIFILHNRTGELLPTKEAFLSTGTISLCIAGASYRKSRLSNEGYRLNDFFGIAGPLFLLLVYGFLIAINVTTPIISNTWMMIISLILFFCCILWSSVIWLQVQGIEKDKTEIPPQPESDVTLTITAESLPKVTSTIE